MTASLLMSKIISLAEVNRRSFARGQQMESYNERRRDERFETKQRLFVQIVGSENTDLVGTTVSCNALDTSAGGLRIESSEAIPQGSKLDIWVDIASRPGKFFLTSDVRWSYRAEDGSCQCGVELQEGATTDIHEWRMVHA